MSQKKTLILVLVGAICFVLISIGIFAAYRSEVHRVTCAKFRYQEQATRFMATEKEAGRDASYLDRNHNGIACESLPHEPVTQ